MKLTQSRLADLVGQELKSLLSEAKKKRKKGKAKDQSSFGTDLANSEDEVARLDAWAGGDNLNDPKDWQKALNLIEEESHDILRHIIRDEVTSLINEEAVAGMDNPLPSRSKVGEKLLTKMARTVEEMQKEDPRLKARIQLKVKLESKLIDEAMVSKYNRMDQADIGKFWTIMTSATWNCPEVSTCMKKYKVPIFMKKFGTRRALGVFDEEVNGEYDIALAM